MVGTYTCTLLAVVAYACCLHVGVETVWAQCPHFTLLFPVCYAIVNRWQQKNLSVSVVERKI